MRAPIQLKFGGQKFMWRQICEAYESKIPVLGKICGVKKGALEVDLGTDIKGVAYSSKIRHRKNGIRCQEINDGLLGKQMPFMIEKPSLTAIRLTRKPILVEEMDQEFEELKEGSEVEGEVIGLQSYAAFIKFGMQTGLLHRDELPEGSSPRQAFSLGDLIKTKIKAIDKATKKIVLSL